MSSNKNYIARALFICNEKFLNAASPEGGVKFCTDEYIKLLSSKFELIYVPVVYNKKLWYRLKKKVGLTAYEDYEPAQYEKVLKNEFTNNEVQFVFLNLTNTAPFAQLLKNNWPHVKVILCSHGNESGDHLHAISLHNKFKSIFKITAVYSLGNMLAKESFYRKFIDLVLTVSDVEVGIEKWIGAENVLMVPRIISADNICRVPIKGRLGFIADLSHEPNFFGIKEVCEALKKIGTDGIFIHLAGGGKEKGNQLQQQYTFVKYLGYLTEEELKNETATWTFALNPVFYFSRGVSTKLGKALGTGLPVITTDKGMRGYEWKDGLIPVCKNPTDMARLIKDISLDIIEVNKFEREVLKIQASATSMQETAEKMMQLLSLS